MLPTLRSVSFQEVKTFWREARWFAAEYDDHLVKRDGKWLLTQIKFDGKYFATHADGWADQTG